MDKINIDELKGNEEALQKAEAAINAIGGINFKEGAGRFAGKRDKYVNSLHKFAVTQEKLPPYEEAVVPEKDEETRRVVHTIKGTAANLSVISLQSAALAFEETLKAENPDKALYKAMSDEVERIREALGAAFCHADDTPAAAQSGADYSRLAERLEKLTGYLQTSEAALCEECLAKIKEEGYVKYKAQIDGIVKMVDDYDYFGAEDAAVELIGTLRK